MLLVTLAACADRGTGVTPVTLAVVNARVWTGDAAAPWAEALAVSGERIVAVGTSAAIRESIGDSTRVIDAKGAMLTPGFIDAHVHFLDGGFALASVQLRDAQTKAEFIQRIAAYARTLPKGTWIRNGDWDHTNWGGELPTRQWIDSVTPDNPVWINRLDGHMNLANSLALAAAKVDRNMKDIAGGTIVRDAHRQPTGIFKDNAMALIDAVQPPRVGCRMGSRARHGHDVRERPRRDERARHGRMGRTGGVRARAGCAAIDARASSRRCRCRIGRACATR